MNPLRFLSARPRGVWVATLAAWAVMLSIAVGGYAWKTLAGAQDASATSVEDQIVQEQKRIRLLRAEISRLGAPRRVADLSRQYLDLGPPEAGREITPRDLRVVAAAQANLPAPSLKGAAQP